MFLAYFSGKILKDEEKLNDFKIEEGKFLVLMVTKAKVAIPEATASKSTAPSAVPAASVSAAKPVTVTETETEAKLETSENKASSSVSASSDATAGDDSAKPASVQAQAESQLVLGSELESVIHNIMEMGYERAQVEQALQASFNNPQRAVEYLISGVVPVEEELAELSGSQESDSGPQSAGSESSNPLEFLRSRPQFQQMFQLLRQSPELLDPMMQQLRSTNPQLLDLIRQNQNAFVQLVNDSNAPSVQGTGQAGSANPASRPPTEPADPALSALDGAADVVDISPTEREAIERLKSLGFPEYLVVQVYFACEKNENMAADFLFSSDS
jgi:UV excision repair protein RAD23